MYDSPHQFEPLLVQIREKELLERAAALAERAAALTRIAHDSARAEIRKLVRSMNSYYSNRIEGQGTHPKNIARALERDFSAQPEVARLQRIALAHIEAEVELEQRVKEGAEPCSSGFLLGAHERLYSRLNPADRRLDGEGAVVEPGVLRERDVTVGRHVPPQWNSVPGFLQRLDEAYAHPMQWDRKLLAIACLHHRAAWVHPFLDGNGRATRLQTHAALSPLSGGLWSVSRGLARDKQHYYASLANADAERRGALDGRGNLTAAGLTEWVEYFLGICEDQLQFMSLMLDLDDMKRRIEALVVLRAASDKRYRKEAILPLMHLFAAGPLTRGEFIQLTGLGERTARSLLSNLLADKLVLSDSKLGPVRFGMPLDALGMLFPGLYPEVDSKVGL